VAHGPRVRATRHGPAVAPPVAPASLGPALEARTAGPAHVMATIRALVVKMAAANPLWEALRIHGELRTLGLEVSERTVSRLLRPRRLDVPNDLPERVGERRRRRVAVGRLVVPEQRLTERRLDLDDRPVSPVPPRQLAFWRGIIA